MLNCSSEVGLVRDTNLKKYSEQQKLEDVETYLFANKRANRMKVLVHDGIGIWLAARRLQPITKG